LRAAGVIKNQNVPILGLNTDPSRSIGKLCNKAIENEEKEKKLENIFTALELGHFEYFYRTRLNFRVEDHT